jgi:hypothetical protein
VAKTQAVQIAAASESATKLRAASYDFAANILSQTMTMTTSIHVLQ